MVGSYMIADQKHRLMAGHGWVTSAGQDMSSLRAEMGGLLGGMAAISHILQLDPTTIRLSQITLDVYMDNSALISWINQWRHGGPSSTLLTDYDLFQVTMKLADELQINLVPHHVKAHQDDDCPYDLLPWQAKLNVDCDLQAAQVRRCTTCKGVSRSYTLPPGHKATLQIGTTYIISHSVMLCTKKK